MALELPSWAPSVEEVANRLISRTRLPNGTLAGTFTASTTPKATQVENLIKTAVSQLRPRLGEVSERTEEQATMLTICKVAYMIELSVFTEQVESGISPYRSLYKEYCEALAEWDMQARGMEPNSLSQLGSIHVGTLYPGYATGTL